jgi:hypothetical protein
MNIQASTRAAQATWLLPLSSYTLSFFACVCAREHARAHARVRERVCIRSPDFHGRFNFLAIHCVSYVTCQHAHVMIIIFFDYYTFQKRKM